MGRWIIRCRTEFVLRNWGCVEDLWGKGGGRRDRVRRRDGGESFFFLISAIEMSD